MVAELIDDLVRGAVPVLEVESDVIHADCLQSAKIRDQVVPSGAEAE